MRLRSARGLIGDLERRPSVAVNTVKDLADDQTMQQQVAQNLGQSVQREISTAAKTQADSAQKLAPAMRNPKFDQGDISEGGLAALLAASSGNAMAYTQSKVQCLDYAVLFERSRKLNDVMSLWTCCFLVIRR
ncbi:MAG: hypothetical protein HC788_10885 [Sphingopyxis sp.]|nr:hypothetical protein [Sphingopyxis sp.]